MVAADEPNARKHMELESVPNLQVDLLLTQFLSSTVLHIFHYFSVTPTFLLVV